MFLGDKLHHDNAPAHNLILSKTWFSENEFEILENWPSNSPTSILSKMFGVCWRKEFYKDIPEILKNIIII